MLQKSIVLKRMTSGPHIGFNVKTSKNEANFYHFFQKQPATISIKLQHHRKGIVYKISAVNLIFCSAHLNYRNKLQMRLEVPTSGGTPQQKEPLTSIN